MSDMRAAIGEAYRAGRSAGKYDRMGKTPATQKRGRSRTRSRGRSTTRRTRSASTGGVRKRLRFSAATASRSRSRAAVRLGQGLRGSAEYSYRKFRSAKPRRVTINKLRKVLVDSRVLRWQRVRPMNRAYVADTAIPSNAAYQMPGALVLRNLVARSGTNTDTYTVPVHMYNINCTWNTNTTTLVGHELRFDDAGNVSYNSIQGTNAGGVDTDSWDVEWRNGYNGAANNTPYTRYIVNSWYEVRLLLYSASAQPTQYEITVFKFKDGYLDLLETPSNSQEVSDRHAFYQGLGYAYAKNPILTMGQTKVQWAKTRVLYRKVVDIAPNLNTEEDGTPNRSMVKIYIPDGTSNDYAYHADGFSGTAANDRLGGYTNGDTAVTIDNDPSRSNYVQQMLSTADYSNRPKARARIWLCVRALNTSLKAEGFTTGNIAISDTNSPSYDMIIRKKEMYNGGAQV